MSFALGAWRVHRVGCGAMQLAGDNVFGPPRDREDALHVLRVALDNGINHIHTAQYYGPGVVNELIREVLYPYPSDLAIVSKVAARRDDAGGVLAYDEPDQLRAGIEENLRTLGVDRLAVVNLCMMDQSPVGPRFDAQLAALIDARDERLIDGTALAISRLDTLIGQQDRRRSFASKTCSTLLISGHSGSVLAWLLGVASNILLTPGTRTRAHLTENI